MSSTKVHSVKFQCIKNKFGKVHAAYIFYTNVQSKIFLEAVCTQNMCRYNFIYYMKKISKLASTNLRLGMFHLSAV